MNANVSFVTDQILSPYQSYISSHTPFLHRSYSLAIISLPVSSTSSPSSSSSLPILDELIVSCFAKVPRCDYPSLSLVSKPFSRLIASPEINLVRSLSQCTENVLYVVLGFNREQTSVWYALNQKPYKEGSNPRNHRLVPFPSFPSLPCWGASVTLIGNEIYVFGGCINGKFTSNVFVIDSRFGTYRFLPSMCVHARGCAAVGVVNEKIYVIGGCKKEDSLDKWIEVFDVKSQIWECFSGLCDEEVCERTLKSLVMNEKIYIMDHTTTFVYDPKEGSWESGRIWKDGCVIDNMLYTFGYLYKINIYDARARSWTFLKGVDEDLPIMLTSDGSRMANHGGKLVILYFNPNANVKTEIWYT